MLRCDVDHVDGTYNALERNHELDWLKAPLPDNECRILSNARCLSEGVDVPGLDAVLFLNPRNSRGRRRAVRRPGHAPRRREGVRLHHPAGRRAGGRGAEQASPTTSGSRSSGRCCRRCARTTTGSTPTVNKIELNKNAERLNPVGHVPTGDENLAGTSESPEAMARLATSPLRSPSSWRFSSSRVARRHLRQDRRQGRDPHLLGKLGQRRRGHRRRPADPHQGTARRRQHRRSLTAFDEFVGALRANLNDSITAIRRDRHAVPAPDHQTGVRRPVRGLRLRGHNPVSRSCSHGGHSARPDTGG